MILIKNFKYLLLTKPLLVAILLAILLILFMFLLLTSSLQAPVLAYTPIHLIQLSDIRPILEIYNISLNYNISAQYILGTKLICKAYI